MNKKSEHLTSFFLFLYTAAIAQVEIGTNTPNVPAQLDVTSTSKGF